MLFVGCGLVVGKGVEKVEKVVIAADANVLLANSAE